jgi:hypothetical protein
MIDSAGSLDFFQGHSEQDPTPTANFHIFVILLKIKLSGNDVEAF